MAGLRVLTEKLQSILDQRRQNGRLVEPGSPAVMRAMTDFGSNDTLSLSSSGVMTEAFLAELNRHPGFKVGSAGSRVVDGSTQYLIDLENYAAKFHGAETALFVNSGFDANVAIWSTIPQPGDVVVYDEYIHASIHDGMRRGRAETKMFLHNDCVSLRRCLLDVKLQHPDIEQGKRVVFISLESFYSMDGDAAPILEMIQLAKEVLPLGNALFVIDEAHSNGLVGPQGSGFVCHYGLEKEFAIRLHTCGKGMGSAGAFILANQTIKDTLLNYARNLIFSTAATFPTLAAVKAGYSLVASEEGEMRRQRLQDNIRHFYKELTGHPMWSKYERSGILTIPSIKGSKAEPFQSPIVALVTRVGKGKSLGDKLKKAGYWVNVVYYPIVPIDKERARLSLHADNTSEQIENVVKVIVKWAAEQYDCLLENSSTAKL
ncbi:hypothetical protein VTN02DRAFT_6329 [Thermoascus thermophilus]